MGVRTGRRGSDALILALDYSGPAHLGVGALLDAVPGLGPLAGGVAALAEDHIGRVAEVVARKSEGADDAASNCDAVAQITLASILARPGRRCGPVCESRDRVWSACGGIAGKGGDEVARAGFEALTTAA